MGHLKIDFRISLPKRCYSMPLTKSESKPPYITESNGMIYNFVYLKKP